MNLNFDCIFRIFFKSTKLFVPSKNMFIFTLSPTHVLQETILLCAFGLNLYSESDRCSSPLLISRLLGGCCFYLTYNNPWSERLHFSNISDDSQSLQQSISSSRWVYLTCKSDKPTHYKFNIIYSNRWNTNTRVGEVNYIT